MSDFLLAYQYMIPFERGVANDPADPGGFTVDGIRLDLLGGYDGITDREQLLHMTEEQKQSYYHDKYWRFDSITEQRIANYMLDMSVNHGLSKAVIFAQRAIQCVFGEFEAIVEDGVYGPNTIRLINRWGLTLLPILRGLRSQFYRGIASAHPLENKFLHTWLKRTMGIHP